METCANCGGEILPHEQCIEAYIKTPMQDINPDSARYFHLRCAYAIEETI